MNKTAVVITLLVIGFANAAAIWLGLGAINRTIQIKQFASFSSQEQTAIALSGDRFMIADGTTVSVYQVGPKGEVTRLSDVDVYQQELKPRKRFSPAKPKLPGNSH